MLEGTHNHLPLTQTRSLHTICTSPQIPFPTPDPTLTANQLKGSQEWRIPLLPIFGAPVPLKSWFSLGPTSLSVLFHLLPPAFSVLPIPTSQSHPHPSSPCARRLVSPAFLT